LISDYAFESSLMIKGKVNGKTKIYHSLYIEAIKAILYNLNFDKKRLLNFFIHRLKSDPEISVQNAIKRKSYIEINKYFKNNDYIINLLCRSNGVMEKEEEFAYNIGKIAGYYIKFKEHYGEVNNSMNSILTYDKYDIDRLKSVFQLITRGLFLSKIDEKYKQEVYAYINEHIKSTEGVESGSHSKNDLAYFFYKGVFEELGKEDRELGYGKE
ncbi:MAG: hypothetical protein QXN16_02885, partial [Candidatus Micrarchaeaceae archaeon]